MAFADLALPRFFSGRFAYCWWVAVFAFPFVLWATARRSRLLSKALLVGSAGFIGMVLETVLILHYQVKQGILFQDLGVLLMSFMAGLAIGALGIERWLRSTHRNAGASKVQGAVILAGFPTLCGLIYLYFNWFAGALLAESALLLLMTGFLVAAVFAYASLNYPGDQRRVVTALYAGDLIGGCLGSVAASLFLIPILGLAKTSLISIPVIILAIFLL
jgi:hypothetical protein